MHWRILAVGKPKLAFARAGIDEYEARLRAFTAVEISYLPPKSSRPGTGLPARPGSLVIGLDERGEEVSSRELAARISDWELSRYKEVSLLVGGADGHSQESRAGCHWLWSLSRMTLQHELALVVALEQLYRAYTIKAGLPYHRQ